MKVLHLSGLILCILVFGKLVTANIIPQAEKNNLQIDPGLYGDENQVFILNAKNFEANVHDGKRAWIVEFYVSWCGFCQRFAPIWKSFVKNAYGWKDIVAAGVIDCSSYINTQICREYGVKTYPTVKYFHFGSTHNKSGIFMEKDYNENFVKQKLIEQLIKDEENHESGPKWPHLVPYNNSVVKTFWDSVSNNVTYQFLIFEELSSFLGAEVILDLHKLENVRIARLTSSNSDLTSTLNVNHFPTVVIIERNDTSEHLKTENTTREGIVKAIIGFLESKGISTEIKEDEFDEIHKNNQQSKSTSRSEELNLTGDKLYSLDLEAAIRYSLNNEIPLSLDISGEKMTALKTYLKVIAEYIPKSLSKLKTYLTVLQEVIETKSNITGEEFKKLAKQKEKELVPVYSPARMWLGCRGSESRYRGYPCGMWTTFHTLTVSSAVNESQQKKNDTPSVLTAIHGYMKNFFGCADCVQHFLKMSAEKNIFDHRSKNNDVLWLWKAHNEVNQRLAGDISEDPKHKKIQYPSSEYCPDCRLSNDKWNQVEVLKYLKEKYSKVNDGTA